MANLTPESGQSGWKTQTYVLGAAIGSLVGLISAYLYARAAEEDAARLGKPDRLQTNEMIGLGLALLAVVRQIAELGKSPQKK